MEQNKTLNKSDTKADLLNHHFISMANVFHLCRCIVYIVRDLPVLENHVT